MMDGGGVKDGREGERSASEMVRTVGIRAEEEEMQIGLEELRQLLVLLRVLAQRLEEVQPLVELHHLVLL